MTNPNDITQPRCLTLQLTGHALTNLLLEARKANRTLEEELADLIEFVYTSKKEAQDDRQNSPRDLRAED